METRGSLGLASNQASQLMNFRFSEKSYLKTKIGSEKGTGPMLTSDLPLPPTHRTNEIVFNTKSVNSSWTFNMSLISLL